MKQPKQSFFDQKTLLAIIITTIVWLGWQFHLQKKYPNQHKPTQAQQVGAAQTQGATEAITGTVSEAVPTASQAKNDEIAADNATPEQTVAITGTTWSFKISSWGMGLKDFELKNYHDRQGVPIKIGTEVEGRLPFATELIGRRAPLNFTIEKVSETHYVGRARAAGVEVVKTLVMDENKYRIDTEVQVQGQSDSFLGLTTYMVDPLMHFEGGSFLAPTFERQEAYALGSESSERLHLAPDQDLSVRVDKMQVAALGTQYFTQALVDRSDVRPELKTEVSASKKTVVTSISHSLLNRGDNMQLKYTAFMGPKNLQLLRTVDESLIGVVDFGFFALLGRPILSALKWFHEVTGNWGIAIILLTILVRFLVLPFNVMSFRSMKAMQVIQPMIADLKTRYKDDQARLNQEMLQLFKTYKVNPVGGCLPVLMQIPVFFALYQVLGHSVELYQAPFMLWIHDLSFKDPYFVLPILMGATMFIQMRLTPSSADPMQAKILMFMPLIMTVFMLALPSGLTLYIFISTVFGIVQQLYLMKSSPLTPVTAKK
ncbi:MAG: membrane protein insertase YidC [Bdellovibrionales bacterium]